MPILIPIQYSCEPFDPYQAFKSAYEKKLLEMYKAGAVLYTWRGTCPHNWWLAAADGTECMIAGDRETIALLDINCTESLRGLMPLSVSHEVSTRLIAPGFGHRDGGKPEKEGWVFSPEAALAAETAWNELCRVRQAREASTLPFRPDLPKLSAEAVMLLRRLKRDAVRPLAELKEIFCELDAQGWLQMDKTGRINLAPEAKSARLPRGLSIQLQFD